MNYYERALELQDSTVENRRYIHRVAEVGLDLPETRAYVMKTLKSYGIEASECGHGVTATIGKGGKTILLRADMDALPMREESQLEFACEAGDRAHACGHDLHTAMLLTAARMLKEREEELEGTVKLMFQPGEEIFKGSLDMIEAGILENPKVDAVIAYHVAAGKMPLGIFMYNSKDTMMFSVDGFKITIRGKGAHGAYPHMGIDPINIGVHIHLALQELIARESDPADKTVLTIGKFNAGAAANIIPDTCVLEGTIRSDKNDSRKKMVARMQEVAVKVAEVYGGSAEVEMTSECPPLVCDGKLTEEVAGYMQQLGIPGMYPYPGIQASASEDLAYIAEQVPVSFMYLSSGFQDERGDHAAHTPKVQFNEDVMPIGASCMAHCAAEWLKAHAE